MDAKKRWKPKKRVKRPYAIRKPKDYAVQEPGDIVQVDTLDLHPFPGVQLNTLQLAMWFQDGM